MPKSTTRKSRTPRKSHSSQTRPRNSKGQWIKSRRGTKRKPRRGTKRKPRRQSRTKTPSRKSASQSDAMSDQLKKAAAVAAGLAGGAGYDIYKALKGSDSPYTLLHEPLPDNYFKPAKPLGIASQYDPTMTLPGTSAPFSASFLRDLLRNRQRQSTALALPSQGFSLW